jgi:hypothetical protein
MYGDGKFAGNASGREKAPEYGNPSSNKNKTPDLHTGIDHRTIPADIARLVQRDVLPVPGSPADAAKINDVPPNGYRCRPPAF